MRSVGTETASRPASPKTRTAPGVMGTAAAPRGIAIQVTGGDRVEVPGERFLLAQAVSNLVQNALEFSPADGVVTVELAAAASGIRLTVTDGGPGIPGYALERVFDRFYSLPRPDTGRKSSGLGLSIVREIARLHGGEVELANRSEGGARATLSLPVA